MRDVGFYLLLAAILLMTVFALRGFNADLGPKYSEIRQLLEQQKVAEVLVREEKLTLTLREGEFWHGESTVTYDLPSFSVFYNDFNDLIVSQQRAGIITQYDYPPGTRIPVWVATFVPWVVILAIFGLLWYFMFLRQSGAGGGGAGGDKTARFGKARTRTGAGT